MALSKQTMMMGAILLLLLGLTFYMGKCWEGFGGEATLFYFYMPGCPYCEKFHPEWDRFVAMAKKEGIPVTLTKLDGTKKESAEKVARFGVQGFPTLVLDKDGKAMTYDGRRSADDLLAWTKKAVAASA